MCLQMLTIDVSSQHIQSIPITFNRSADLVLSVLEPLSDIHKKYERKIYVHLYSSMLSHCQCQSVTLGISQFFAICSHPSFSVRFTGVKFSIRLLMSFQYSNQSTGIVSHTKESNTLFHAISFHFFLVPL